MGKKVERWTRERAAEQLAPEMAQYRPVGFESVPLAPQPEPKPKPNHRSDRRGRLASRTGSATGLNQTTNYRPLWQLSEAKERFLAEYAERGTMVECARLAGLSYQAVQHAIEKDAEFAEGYRQAEQAVLEKLEREAMRRAVEGTVVRSRKFWHGEMVGEDIRTEYSDNLLMLLLRAKAPERYRDNSLITINQVIKAVEGFDPAEVLGLPAPAGA